MTESSTPVGQTQIALGHIPAPSLMAHAEQHRKSLFGYELSEWLIFIIMGVVTSFILGLVEYVPLLFVAYQTELWTLETIVVVIFIPITALRYCVVIPMVGKYFEKLGGPYRLFNIGCLLIGVALICNGFIQFIGSFTLLIVVLYGLGAIQMIGEAMIYVISIAVTTFQFSKFIGTVFGIIQIVRLVAIRYCSRPLSLYLYQVGPVGKYAFVLPFSFVGNLFLLLIPISLILLGKYDLRKTNNGNHNEQSTIAEESQLPEEQYGFLRLLKFNTTKGCIFTVFCVTFSIGFLPAFIFVNPQRFWLWTEWTDTGSLFFNYFLRPICMLALPVSGLLCDKRVGGNVILIIGTVLVIAGSVIIGPLPLFIRLFWMDLIGLAILLLGCQVVIVSSFVVGVEGARKHGFPDSVTTNALVFGLWELGHGVGGNLGSIILEFVIGSSTLHVCALILQFALVLSATFVARLVNDKPTYMNHPLTTLCCI